MKKSIKTLIVLGVTIVIIVIGATIFRGGCVVFVDSYELGYRYNQFTGKTEKLTRTGYFIINPWKYDINTIDLRPHQIRIEANNRVLNSKLVRFRPEGLDQFLEMHGRGDYYYSNLNTTGSGTSTTGNTTDLGEILKSYAYESYFANGSSYSEDALEQKYKFLDIMSGTNSNPTGKATSIDSLTVN